MAEGRLSSIHDPYIRRRRYGDAPPLCREYQHALESTSLNMTIIAQEANCAYNTVVKYQRQLPASVAILERILNVLGYDLVITKRRRRD